MYDFSFFDMNRLVAGVLLAMTAHSISTTADETPAQVRHRFHHFKVHKD